VSGKAGCARLNIIPFVIRPRHYDPSWPRVLFRALTARFFIALTQTALDDAALLGPRSHFMQLFTTLRTKQMHTWVFPLSEFGLPVPLHYFNDPLSWLLYLQNQASFLLVDCSQLLIAFFQNNMLY
jgi:branched-subunit amino acid transport protein AzlD